MVVGVLTVELHLYEATSLKEKRHVVRSTLDTLRNRFNLSAAEIDHLDEWQFATLGFSCVGNDRQHVNSVLNKALDFLHSDPRIEVVAVNMELW
ncbi:MAG: DUF503 domain-containing protein [Armatimonadota bacterium]|nr:DUF503 domain-containing protein [bacterium]MCS7309503.1 DUF503 domain-containing protein [Armatimonadota bacterium]MDW8103466.1 DUF503 domain-containing protein [Armatimonadota bacterium]MDW8290054.1 DUF503 domain-containing protein [Armatimonadota bacterium]